MKIKSGTSLLMAGLMAAGNTAVHAQQERESLVLEEVLVVARKREENVQDVSIAVSALSGTELTDAHIRDSAELSKLVPSLTVGEGGGNSFVIRGIGTLVFTNGAEASVSTMLDGVVLGRSNQSFMKLVDIQRVEVLRGPQGTLFGKNSTAGVVHFITKDPSDEFEGQMNATAIEDDEYRLGGTVSGPLTDTLGARLTYGGVRDDGYIKNVYDGDYYNGGDSDTVRLKMRWEPTYGLDLKWSSDYTSEDDTARVRPPRIVADPAIAEELLPVVASDDNDEVNLDGNIFKDIDTWGHALNIDWDLGEHTLTSITGYREYEQDAEADNDGRPTNPQNFTQKISDDQSQFTQEFRLVSPADKSLRYVVGVYAFLQELDKENARTFPTGGNVATSKVENTNYAAFGELTYDITDTVRGIVGGRFTYDELEYDFKRTGNVFPEISPTDDSADDTDFSPKLALEWDVLDDAMTYVSYAEGYKGQAFNVTFGTQPGDPIDPELSTTYEWGIKSTLLGGRVRLNVALFRTDYDDFQSQALIDDDNTTAFILTNAGDVRTEGLEVDITGRVTENLTIFGGVAFIDASLEEFENAPCSNGQKFYGECPESQVQDISGGDLPFSPDWKVSLNANYAIPLETMPFDLVVKASYQGQDDMLTDISQDKRTVQDSYNVFDLALSMEAGDGHWDATVFVKNITDENYTSAIISDIQIFNPGGYSHVLPKNASRTVGAEVRYYWF
jgi:iron complex outermembrane receptor protein